MSRLLILALLALLTGCLGYVPGQQSYWDAKVRNMCEKDGGAKIHEVVELDKAQYDLFHRFGKVEIPGDGGGAGGEVIFLDNSFTLLHDGNPSINRNELKIIRKSDGKVLGSQVTYSRVGGDIPSPAHHSSFMCPSNLGNFPRNVVKLRGASN